MIEAQARPHVTADEFLVHPAAAGPGELVRGEIRTMTPASGAHGAVVGGEVLPGFTIPVARLFARLAK